MKKLFFIFVLFFVSLVNLSCSEKPSAVQLIHSACSLEISNKQNQVLIVDLLKNAVDIDKQYLPALVAWNKYVVNDFEKEKDPLRRIIKMKDRDDALSEWFTYCQHY